MHNISVFGCALLVFSSASWALPTVNITTTDNAAAEAGPDEGSFTVTRSGDIDLSAALTVRYLAEGMAVWNTDYTLAPVSVQAWPNLLNVTIHAGQESMTVTLTAIFEENVEGDEDAVFTLQGLNSYVKGIPDSTSITIVDFTEMVFKDSFETLNSE